MSRKVTLGLLVALSLLSPCNRVHADEIAIAYDIFEDSSALVTWVDLSPFVGTDQIRQLRDGVDLLLECRFELVQPRKIFADRRIASRRRALLVSFRTVTEDFVVTNNDPDSTVAGPFLSLAGLHRYLQDSVETQLVNIDSLDPGRAYALRVSIASISLTDINMIAPSNKPNDAAESPVRFLFRQFLSYTGYGREEYRTTSRHFTINAIPGPLNGP